MAVTSLAVKKDLLQGTSFGARTAEEEADVLANYFVQTDQWKRMLRGEIDVVYGAKGTGKSAIYTLLEKSADTVLFNNNILTATAENPRGATVFRNIVAAPPASEREFISLWKTYIVSVIGRRLQEYKIDNSDASEVIRELTEHGLLPVGGGLPALFRAARNFVARFILREPTSVTYGLSVDQATGMMLPTRTAEYNVATPVAQHELMSPDELLEKADTALAREGFKLWVLFDRLDVAFEESRDLEKNALRALFRVYNDLRGLGNISLKIFVRDDIWRRITEDGFAEASHITRTVTIRWDNPSLMNLAVRRLLNNPCIVSELGAEVEAIMADIEQQKKVFYQFFPRQIDIGPNKSETFEWLLGRTKDGTGVNTPRELIHFLSELRDEQIRRLERGESVPNDELLFDRSIFKTALKAVSEVRLTQTLLAEYAELKPYVMAMNGEKASHTPSTLARIWNVETSPAREKADALAKVGFFELRGDKQSPQYWVPFLYRDALSIVQGSAD